MRRGTAEQRAARITVRWNRHTLALAAMLAAMWYAAAAQTNGAVYLLAFACAGMAVLSWLHARANLRDIDLQTGDLILNQHAGCYRIPFRLVSRSRRVVSGIEIAVAGAKAPVFVGQLKPAETFHSELQIPAAAFESDAPVTLVLRSLYPLGFFTAGKSVPLVQGRRAQPFPKGNLPLPPLVKAASTSSAGGTGTGTRGSAGNDDFAGVRGWQPGDSPRHIDWKAVARERPLMTKQWAGSQEMAAILDWSATPLADEEKPGQIARWMQDCEAGGTLYSLVLPGQSIPAGSGPHHMKKCLDALGEMVPARAVVVDGRTRQRIPFMHETASGMSAAPVWMMSTALVMTLPPMFGHISLLSMVLFLTALMMRIRAGARACPMLLRIAFVLTGGVLVLMTEREYRSMEAATALLLVFIGGKFIESRSPRDFQVVGLLGWFLCMCGLALEQSLGWSLYTTAVFLLITASLVRLRRHDRGAMQPVHTALLLTAQALPVMLLLFIFFPRGSEDFVTRLARRNMSQSGLSSNLTPGMISKVALSDALAFRAEIGDGAIVRTRDRYWRCMVLWECDGLAWRRGGGSNRTEPVPRGAKLVRQTITVEPHGSFWLPALDRPVAIGRGSGSAVMGEDQTVIAGEPVDNARRFTVFSLTTPPSGHLNEIERSIALRVPADISGHVENLAMSFRPSVDTQDHEVVKAALGHFRSQGFKYTLEPGPYENNGLEEFLLRRKLGFCEHFSSAFATLMRLAGVPARVVIGYLGGEDTGRGYWRVRQCDAHAWAEVWLKDGGWTRIDPTAELAPDRISSDLETFLAGGDNSFLALRRQTWWWSAWTEARLLWDRLDYEWYNRVIAADDEAQMDTLTAFGFSRVSRTFLLLASVGGVALVAFLVAVWLKRPARHPDPAARLWLHVCSQLARAGVKRASGETATAFADRAALSFPYAAVHLRAISDCYNELRYRGGTRTLEDLKHAIKQLPPLKA